MKKLFLMVLVAFMSLQCAAQITVKAELNSKNHFEYWTNRKYLKLDGLVVSSDTLWSIRASSTTNRFDDSPVLYLGKDLNTALESISSLYDWLLTAEEDGAVTIEDCMGKSHILIKQTTFGVETMYISSPQCAGQWSLTPKCFKGTIDKIKELIDIKNRGEKFATITEKKTGFDWQTGTLSF